MCQTSQPEYTMQSPDTFLFCLLAEHTARSTGGVFACGLMETTVGYGQNPGGDSRRPEILTFPVYDQNMQIPGPFSRENWA